VLNAEGQLQQTIVVKGQYSFTGTDGLVYLVIYTADENGYNAIITKTPKKRIQINLLKSAIG
jgi:hypothetical protein